MLEGTGAVRCMRAEGLVTRFADSSFILVSFVLPLASCHRRLVTEKVSEASCWKRLGMNGLSLFRTVRVLSELDEKEACSFRRAGENASLQPIWTLPPDQPRLLGERKRITESDRNA